MSKSSNPYSVELRPLDFFHASEHVNQQKVEELADKIRSEGYWTTPLPVEGRSGLVMDGNHRLQVAKALGLKWLPCVPLEYGDARVEVKCWQSGQPYVGVERLWDRVSRHGLLPFKTTRHLFNPPLPKTEIALQLLL